MIAIVNYGMGNLHSVQKALEHLGATAHITSDPADLGAADAVVLPGVGAFGAAMQRLNEAGLTDALRRAIETGKPFLGICLGLQLLFESSSESPGVAGLGILKGRVVGFAETPDFPLRIPHMGWSRLRFVRHDCPLWRGVPDGAYVYFVHSYYAVPEGDVDLPPSLRFPPLREGNRAEGSVPPACEGNRAEGSVPPACEGNRAEGSVPPACEGNRAGESVPPACEENRAGESVPPACRGNLKEGVLPVPADLAPPASTNLQEGVSQLTDDSVPPACRGNLKEGVSSLITAYCDYGVRFACAVGVGNLYAVQFHPEKSSDTGLQILRNFLALVGAAPCRP
jgi:glutamine amidotransferase